MRGSTSTSQGMNLIPQRDCNKWDDFGSMTFLPSKAPSIFKVSFTMSKKNQENPLKGSRIPLRKLKGWFRVLGGLGASKKVIPKDLRCLNRVQHPYIRVSRIPRTPIVQGRSFVTKLLTTLNVHQGMPRIRVLAWVHPTYSPCTPRVLGFFPKTLNSSKGHNFFIKNQISTILISMKR